jgi:hypothetical protein
MTVYGSCDFNYSMDTTFYVAKFMGGMIYNFQDLDFGDGVKEIVYHGVTSDTPFLNFLEDRDFKAKYGRRNKGISTYFVMDHKITQELEGEGLLSFVAEKLILETTTFAEKKIKDFNLEGYIKNLRQHLNEALHLMSEGKDPSEGKVLNKEIELAMQKKWAKL